MNLPREVCRVIAAKEGAYQFGGYDGVLKKHFYLVDADYCQLIHWILRGSGYKCCPADIMRRCGHFAECKQEGLLEIKSEMQL